MGLHQRTRDYLYQEFVRRNYQGASEELKKALLSLRPDDMAGIQKAMARDVRRQEALGEWIAKLGPHRKDLEKQTLELLRKEGGLGRLAFYRAGIGPLFERKCVVGGDAGFPKSLHPDFALKPKEPQACIVAAPEWPWSHDLRNQGLTGRHALFQKSGRPSALLAWSNATPPDPFTLLILELLAIFRGDRALPIDPPAPPPPKKKAPGKTKPKAPPKAKKAVILEPSRLLKRKLISPSVLESEGSAQARPPQDVST